MTNVDLFIQFSWWMIYFSDLHYIVLQDTIKTLEIVTHMCSNVYKPLKKGGGAITAKYETNFTNNK